MRDDYVRSSLWLAGILFGFSMPVGAQQAVGAQQVSAGGLHACVIDNSGAAQCWGSNFSGQLGDGKTKNSLIPVQVEGLDRDVTAISAGGAHTCAVHNSAAKCWGGGQLGDGKTENSLIPVQVEGLDSDVTAIAAGGAHTCAVHNSAAKCWGSGFNGQLGNGGEISDNEKSPTPVQVEGLDRDVTAISASGGSTCAVHNSAAKCWGAGRNGQLGNGETESSSTPVQVQGLDSDVTAISTGFRHTCAIQDDAAKCWGLSGSGQLGDGETVEDRNSLTPVQVQGLGSDVTAIAVGYNYTCAIQGSAAKCWGLEQIDLEVFETPSDVTNLGSGVTAITVGRDGGGGGGGFSCAIQSGDVLCWGLNTTGVPPFASFVGQLGIAGVNQVSIPSSVGTSIPAAVDFQVTPGNTLLRVHWKLLQPREGNYPIAGYQVSWQTVEDSGGATPDPVLLDGARRSYTIMGLNNETEYSVTVRAMNHIGVGAETVVNRMPSSAVLLLKIKLFLEGAFQ